MMGKLYNYKTYSTPHNIVQNTTHYTTAAVLLLCIIINYNVLFCLCQCASVLFTTVSEYRTVQTKKMARRLFNFVVVIRQNNGR